MTSGAATLAIATIRFEERNGSPLSDVAIIYSGGPDGARALLSTIAGSMITIAGVSFSIVIVALSLASNQFGHRLLRNFMRDRANQVVLGTFISTFVYCLLTLRAIRSVEDGKFVPHLSVTFGIGFALLSLAVFIYFIHHVSSSIQADHVIKVVAEDLDQCVERLFPEQLGEGSDSYSQPDPGEWKGWGLRPKQDGYLQAVDDERLMELAVRHELKIDLQVRPGSFLTKGIAFASISPAISRTEDLEAELLGCLSTGSARTTQQDVEFAIEQLVEIAVRALSPGINAPYTAVACLDRLLQAFSRLIDRQFPSPLRLSHEGVPRVMAQTTDFGSLLHQAFDPIRHYGATSPIVLFRMMEVLGLLVARCPHPERRDVLIEQAADTRRTGEVNIDSETVVRKLAEQYARIIADRCGAREIVHSRSPEGARPPATLP